MTAENIFGRIITGNDVEDAVEATIRKWLVTYLAEIERSTGRPARSLPPFRSYVVAVTEDRMAEDQLPACVIIAPGLTDVPRKNGDGTHDASWGVGVAAVVSAKDRESTQALARDYVAAIRLLLVQQGSLDGFAERTWWLEERYDELDTIDTRTIVAGIVQHAVHVRAVANSADGPTEPPDDPYAEPGSWATVEAGGASVTTEPKTDNEP